MEIGLVIGNVMADTGMVERNDLVALLPPWSLYTSTLLISGSPV